MKVSLKFIYHQLVEINDTPHRKAMGLAIGVFCGIFPGTGPLAALAVSFVLKVNRAAALLGSLLTNTWLSLVTLGLAVKIGALIQGEDWQKIQTGAILNALGSVILGFVIVGGLLAMGVYSIAFWTLILQEKAARHKKESLFQ